MDLKKTHIPSWARSRVDNLSKLARGTRKSLDGLTEQRVSESDALHHVSRNREILAEFRLDDENPERDQALGQKGRLLNGGSDIRFEGDAHKGQVSVVRDDAVVLIELNGSETTRIDVNKNGHDVVVKSDLARPREAKSWRTSQPDHGLNIPKSEFDDSTIGAAEILKDQPADSVFRQVFLDGTKSMTTVRGDLIGELKALSGSLSPQSSGQLTELLKKPDANTARRLGLVAKKLRQTDPDNKAVRKLGEVAGTWQALEDFPKLMADGLMRNSINYVSPLHFATQTAAQGWEFDKASGLPIADSVVVGGGPGGLASAYQLSENGHRTVLLEGGNTGQAFSDNHAAPVHQLRTSMEQTNLIYTANANHLGVDVSLTRHRENIAEKARTARDEWYLATGRPRQGFAEEGASLSRPANRNELFEHMSMMSQGLAGRYPDTFVIENSPVNSIQVERSSEGERLFKVSTETGHQMMARSLVLATGFVGTAGEHARSLQQFSDLEQNGRSGVSLLGSDHDLVAKSDRLEKESLVFSDRLLGRPEIRNRIQSLPKDSRLAVIGGGESAAKGALEALHLNPGLAVDIYTNKALEPYQTQIPSSVISANVVESALVDPGIAKASMDSLKDFQTPIVSSTMKKLLEMEASGRVRIRELGCRFDSNSVSVESKVGGGFSFELKDSAAKQSLRDQRRDWEQAGLYGARAPDDRPDQFPDADMVMMSVGYDKRSCQAGPLVQQLVDQGVIKFEDGEVAMGADGLTSAADPMIALNTAAVQKNAADSALPGRAVRAFRLGQYFKDKLPAREEPVSTIGKGLSFNQFINTNSLEETIRPDSKEAAQFMNNGGVRQLRVDHVESRLERITDPLDKELSRNRWEAQKAYPNSTEPLRELLLRQMEVPESLTPVEKVMLDRAEQLRGRL